MALSPELLEILVCPKCKGDLSDQPEKAVLFCHACSLPYPVEEGIPWMMEEEALKVKAGGGLMGNTQSSIVAFFKIQEGPELGGKIELPLNTCKAIGRNVEDMHKTQVLTLDATVPLDDFTKKLILNYISKKMGKSISPSPRGEILGSFRRLPDMVLTDPTISRLHAMIFHDDSGVGVLDLVSRNGTYVNGQEVESKSLKEGDIIEIGATKLLFSLKG